MADVPDETLRATNLREIVGKLDIHMSITKLQFQDNKYAIASVTSAEPSHKFFQLYQLHPVSDIAHWVQVPLFLLTLFGKFPGSRTPLPTDSDFYRASEHASEHANTWGVAFVLQLHYHHNACKGRTSLRCTEKSSALARTVLCAATARNGNPLPCRPSSSPSRSVQNVCVHPRTFSFELLVLLPGLSLTPTHPNRWDFWDFSAVLPVEPFGVVFMSSSRFTLRPLVSDWWC
ncbi:hypothetical protein EDB19DRAFT_1915661 [Suillus lakei]|nr:hypothetical protein EDB19DRAFT_1915661 [Suillus lakei]